MIDHLSIKFIKFNSKRYDLKKNKQIIKYKFSEFRIDPLIN